MTEGKQRYVTVALYRKMPRSLGVLTYAVPEGQMVPTRGVWILVPFRSRTLRAVVWSAGAATALPGKTVLPFSAVLPMEPLTPMQCDLVAWLADSFCVSISHALTTLVPAVSSSVSSQHTVEPSPQAFPMTIERRRADALRAVAKPSADGTTVYTVGALRDQIVLLASLLTASAPGQVLVVAPTHALLDAIARSVRTKGRPRILLDPNAPRARFWSRWSSVRTAKDAVIMTTRKGLCAPFQGLRSIIVLNWSDPSLHQAERNPRYDGRALLTTLAERTGASLTVLDAVVPFDLSEASSVRRIAPRAPHRTVVSLRDERRAGNTAPLADTVLDALRTTPGPCLVFLNRRGATRQLLCPDCGWVFRCSRDEIPLIEHGQGVFHCHVCGATDHEPQVCPNCKNARLVRRGKGTQTLERFLRTAFPDRSIARIDRDAPTKSPQADITVATEKIFSLRPREPFRCCAIVSVESEADRPSYTAVEDAYALFERVAGLCALDGQFFLQAWRAETPLLAALVRNDHDALYKSERSLRALLTLPPAATVIKVWYAAEQERMAHDEAKRARTALHAVAADASWSFEGPYFRVRRGTRRHEASFILRCLSSLPPRATLRTIFSALPDDWLCEVNPNALFML